MRPSQEDNLTENTISSRENRRDIATLRGVMSKRRKRVRRYNSITQRTNEEATGILDDPRRLRDPNDTTRA